MYRLPGLVIALALASGCSNVVSIDADDRTRFSHLDVSLPLDHRKQWRIQLRAATTDGDFNQSIDPGERIEIDEQSIPGPRALRGRLDLTYYSVALATVVEEPTLQAGKVRGHYAIGIAQTEFELELSDATSSFRDDDVTTELYVQGGLSVDLGDALRFGLALAASAGSNLSGLTEIDLDLTYVLPGPLRVSGGYRWLEYQYAEKEDESNIEVDFHGPYLGLEFFVE